MGSRPARVRDPAARNAGSPAVVEGPCPKRPTYLRYEGPYWPQSLTTGCDQHFPERLWVICRSAVPDHPGRVECPYSGPGPPPVASIGAAARSRAPASFSRERSSQLRRTRHVPSYRPVPRRRCRRPGGCRGLRSRLRRGPGAALAGEQGPALAGEQGPALAHSTARYTAPDGERDGSLTFSTEVTASSGVKSLKVLAWPEKSALAAKQLTAKEMAEAEPARCEPAGGDTVRCVYTASVTAVEAASSPRGSWHVAALATAEDGTTTLDTEAVDFTVG
ncbi:DUF5707 domain-containing protein [Streptomyces sp. NPDC096132]|uniref:DUF5707 domain-containing protein n=1 Tax=Streptomyces sp. NPDC096132 TaxID=3366075 RepID=UPI0037FAE626